MNASGFNFSVQVALFCLLAPSACASSAYIDWVADNVVDNPEEFEMFESPDKKWVSPMVGSFSADGPYDRVMQDIPGYGDMKHWGNYADSRGEHRDMKRNIFGRIM